MSCVRCIVSGRVQGVWFRETTRSRAQELGIAGSAVNLPDGTVEVVACGEEAALDELRNCLWTGSPMSRVDQVSCECIPEQTPAPGFRTG